MDYEKYEKLKEMFLKTWPVLIPEMGEFNAIKPYGVYTIEHINSPYNLSGNILRVFGNGSTSMGNLLYELSFNITTKYFSTFTPDSIRIAHWKEDFPRYYALQDIENSSTGDYTFMEFPCDFDFYFQRSTVQETLEYEDYELWDTEAVVMQHILKDHPALSVAVVLRDNVLSPEDINAMCLQFFEDVKKGDKDVK